MSKCIKYIDPEISWLQFNERVLHEARDTTNPLLERVKFLGIYSNNLDEFYRTRVGHLRQLRSMPELHVEYGFNPCQTLQDVYSYSDHLRREFEATYQTLIQALADHHIHMVNEQALSGSQRAFAIDFFRQKVRSNLFPLLLEKIQDHTALNEHSIYLFVKMNRHSKSGTDENYAIVELPTDKLSRFLILPADGQEQYVMMLDDVVRLGFPDIFLPFGYQDYQAYTFKITRNAEIALDISSDTIEMMRQLIARRKRSEVIRFLYDRAMPEEMLSLLMTQLQINEDVDIDPGSRYHNSKDFVKFPTDFGNADLCYPPHIPHDPKDIPIHSNMLQLIRQKDRLLHFPYQSFQMTIDFLREVSIDPRVKAIHMTIYRVAEDSAILNALVNAARNGKDVAVYVEIKARFDEAHNLYWVERLEREGVRVMKILPDYKVHAKMILVTPHDSHSDLHYAAIGTGNPNENTALVYTDKLLFTSHPSITKEVKAVFDLIDNRLSFPEFETLLVAPVNFRNRIVACIDYEILQAKQGKEAWLMFKLNSLSDKDIVDKLYEAAQVGVQVTLMVRGICALNPFADEAANNIHAFSIVGRFLEHSRVYAFGNGGYPAYYIGSADLVRQKMNKRIEVVVPIFDEHIKEELQGILEIQLADNTRSRLIDPEDSNHFYRDGKAPVRSQGLIYQYIKKRHN